MTSKRTIEMKGTDVDSAIAKGLAEMGLNRDEVTIDILDEGSRGLFGLGGRPALVRLTATAVVPEVAPTRLSPVEPPARPAPVVTAPVKPPVAAAPPPPPTPTPTPTPKPKPTVVEHEESEEEVEEQGPLSEAELAAEAAAVTEVVQTILNYLSIIADIQVTVSEPDDMTGRQINMVNLTGNDLGMLIGQRGETLDSIQFIARLMVSHKLQRKATFTLDVESYRLRRKEALARLAERMARKVTKQRRPVTLEPMPPHERRAIHMALRNFKGVYTQSTGTGDRRRVRIYPER
ncbi:MAG: RNA-binding cell elongation regulator Jag/EloR [Candidatus Promineifilaceae bacterium]